MMRIRGCITSGAIFVLTAIGAHAGPATPERADRIAKGIESYLGSQPGLVTVKPSGEVYDVTLDFSAYARLLASSGAKFSVSPQHYRVSDVGGGKWRVEMDEPVTGTFKLAGSAEPKMPSLDAKIKMRVKSVSTFDEALGVFSESIVDAKDLVVDETLSETTGEASVIRYAVKAMHQEMYAAVQGDSIDAKLKAAMEGLEETFDIAGKSGGMPVTFKLSAAKGGQSADVRGLKFAQLKELIRFGLAHADDANKKPLEDELRKLAIRALPVFSRMVADGGMEQVTVDTSIGKVTLDKATVNLAMNGFVSNGEFSEGLVVEGISLPPGLLPSYAAELMPQRLAFDIKLADFDLAEAARVFIAEVDSSKSGQPELDAKLAKVILPHGTMTLSTSTTQVKGKAYDVTLAGDMKVGPTGNPSGQGVIKAQGLDEIVKQLQAAPPEAGTAQAVAGILMAKGFGKVEADSVTWNIEAQPSGAFLVNGVDMSKLAGATPPAQ